MKAVLIKPFKTFHAVASSVKLVYSLIQLGRTCQASFSSFGILYIRISEGRTLIYTGVKLYISVTKTNTGRLSSDTQIDNAQFIESIGGVSLKDLILIKREL